MCLLRLELTSNLSVPLPIQTRRGEDGIQYVSSGRKEEKGREQEKGEEEGGEEEGIKERRRKNCSSHINHAQVSRLH